VNFTHCKLQQSDREKGKVKK